MIASSLTKDFGLIASDSAGYVADEGTLTYENPKLSLLENRYLATYLGTTLYFSRIDLSKFKMPMKHLSVYLQGYLKEVRPDVEGVMKEAIKDKDEQKPNFCLFVLGLHAGRPTLAQFNSFLDFAPRYLWTDNGPKFSSVLYGDDSKPEKQAIFKETTAFMEALSKSREPLTPGLAGEILTRGIYKKADLEEEKTGKKYAGGSVSVAGIKSDGSLFALTGVEVISNGRV